MTAARSHGALAIRSLRPDDADGIVALYAACMATEPGIGPITADGWASTIALPQFGGGRDFLVATLDAMIVAVAESSLRDQGRQRMRNLKLVVDPAVRRRGIGTSLLGAVLAQGPDREPLTLQANVWASWATGVGFLSRFGFAQIETEISMRATAFRPVLDGPEGLAIGRVTDVTPIAGRLAEIHNAAYADDAGSFRVGADEMGSSLVGAQVWTAERDGDIVAYAKIESDDDLSWLESLAVDPAHQGRGIGGILATRAFIGDGVGEGRPAGLSVSSANPRAMRLYARLGFEPRSEKGKYAASRADLLARIGV